MRTQQVRIIGGALRGRRLRFADVTGLRPTGDRVRETLFNWLQPDILGARCLDLFAGSGALGLEAASRGAARVVMMDRVPRVVRQLRDNVATLGLANVEVIQADALRWLASPPIAFDLVFLDPPFADDLLGQVCERLVAGRWLNPGALTYLEADAATGLPALPPLLRWEKRKRAGQVEFGLARYGERRPT
jgi:16S rRNA (guanine966-N2)-methyltransferase